MSGSALLAAEDAVTAVGAAEVLESLGAGALAVRVVTELLSPDEVEAGASAGSVDVFTSGADCAHEAAASVLDALGAVDSVDVVDMTDPVSGAVGVEARFYGADSYSHPVSGVVESSSVCVGAAGEGAADLVALVVALVNSGGSDPCWCGLEVVGRELGDLAVDVLGVADSVRGWSGARRVLAAAGGSVCAGVVSLPEWVGDLAAAAWCGDLAGCADDRTLLLIAAARVVDLVGPEFATGARSLGAWRWGVRGPASGRDALLLIEGAQAGSDAGAFGVVKSVAAAAVASGGEDARVSGHWVDCRVVGVCEWMVDLVPMLGGGDEGVGAAVDVLAAVCDLLVAVDALAAAGVVVAS